MPTGYQHLAILQGEGKALIVLIDGLHQVPLTITVVLGRCGRNKP